MRNVLSLDELIDFVFDPSPNTQERLINRENIIEKLQIIMEGNQKGLNMILLRQIFSIDEVAEIYQCNKRTIYYHIKKVRDNA